MPSHNSAVKFSLRTDRGSERCVAYVYICVINFLHGMHCTPFDPSRRHTIAYMRFTAFTLLPINLPIQPNRHEILVIITPNWWKNGRKTLENVSTSE